MLENVGAEGHVYFGRAMHLFGWAYGHHNAHYRRIIDAMERIAVDSGADGPALRPARQQIHRFRLPRLARAVSHLERCRRRGADPVDGVGPAASRPSDRRRDTRASYRRTTTDCPTVASLRRLPVSLPTSPRHGARISARPRALADRFTWCMAAPIQDKDGTTTATLCLVLPMDTPRGRRAELRSLLRDRAACASLDGRSPGG